MSSTVTNLIEQGEKVVRENYHSSDFGEYISGVDYEEWIAKVIFFMEDNKEKFPTFLYERVIEAAGNAVGNGKQHFDRIIGVLRTVGERQDFQ